MEAAKDEVAAAAEEVRGRSGERGCVKIQAMQRGKGPLGRVDALEAQKLPLKLRLLLLLTRPPRLRLSLRERMRRTRLR